MCGVVPQRGPGPDPSSVQKTPVLTQPCLRHVDGTTNPKCQETLAEHALVIRAKRSNQAYHMPAKFKVFVGVILDVEENLMGPEVRNRTTKHPKRTNVISSDSTAFPTPPPPSPTYPTCDWLKLIAILTWRIGPSIGTRCDQSLATSLALCAWARVVRVRVCVCVCVSVSVCLCACACVCVGVGVKPLESQGILRCV